MKKYLLLLLLTFATVISHSARAEEKPTDAQEISLAGFNIYKTVCFMMFPPEAKDKRIEFLDKNFKRHDGEKKKLFLMATGSKSGEVWGAVFPKAAYAVVVQDNGNCHLVAQKGDSATIHENMATLAKEAQENMKDLTIEPVSKSKKELLESSGFEIKGPNGNVVLVAIGSTPIKPVEDKPAAILSVVVSTK